jgi:hypothetical protein
MNIGEQQLQLLAELKDMPSFILLVKLFRDFEDSVLENVSRAKDSEELLRVTRFYQTVRSIREVLESHPENAFEQLQRIQDSKYSLAEVDPAYLSQSIIHQLRFAQVPEPETGEDVQ